MTTLTLYLTLAVCGQDISATLQTDKMLKAPEGLQGGFSIAKTAPKVEITLFTKLPEGPKGILWSSWGDGLLASNGNYYTSFGDHLGDDSTSYIYEYDPKKKSLKRIIDVAKAIKLKPGEYGHGKVHSGIHEASDGWLYFSSYWGKHRQIEQAFERGYNGSIAMRYHPKTGKFENLGAIVPRQGLPASHYDPVHNLLYFFAVYKGDLVVYDIKKQKVKFIGGGDITTLQRAFLRDNQGRLYINGKEGRLHYYDPEQNKIIPTEAILPNGDSLRAGALPSKSDILYGMTRKGIMFSFDPKSQKITNLGPNFDKGHYTAVMVMSPDEKYLYYLPGAHGNSFRIGSPLVQYEIKTGKRKVLAFLNQAVRDKLGYNLGGTYNLQIDEKGEKLFTTFNGAPYSKNARKTLGFGQPSVLVIHIPASER